MVQEPLAVLGGGGRLAEPAAGEAEKLVERSGLLVVGSVFEGQAAFLCRAWVVTGLKGPQRVRRPLLIGVVPHEADFGRQAPAERIRIARAA